MKEEFFSKFIDYNNRLEKILETKPFSKDAKNLLLSMIYKVDISYSDYQTVKRNVKNKQEFLEDVIKIVENCEKIELIKPNSEEGIEFKKEGINYRVDSLKYEIRVFENEKVMLEALFDLDNTRFYLPEKYNLIRIAFPDLLNEGKAISNVEIIRDFNAWSWNILQDEISNLYANIIYQNLEFLVGQEKLENWLISEEIENKIEWLTAILEEYSKEDVDKFLNLIYQISIDSCTNKNKLEKTRLLDEKLALEHEYNKLSNKEKYLEEITQIKKDKHKEIDKIDKILNDKELLKKEYKIRNEKLKEYNKILNIEHLVEILNKERRKAIRQIEDSNKLLKPNIYLETINKIRQELELLQDIEKVNPKIMENKVIRLEIIFLGFFKQKIKKASKKEMIDFIHLLRYYENIPFSKNIKLGEVEELQSLLQDIESFIINKMYELKQINKISEDKNFNQKVLRNILDTKIINLENVYIKINEHKEGCKLEIYDKETLEKETNLKYDVKEIKQLKIKKNKPIKVFI